jgi:hypothetical protein
LLHDINNNNKVGGNYIRNFVWLWHFEHKSRLYVDGTFWYFQAIQLISQPVHIVPRPAQLVQVKTQSPLKATKLNALSLIYIWMADRPLVPCTYSLLFLFFSFSFFRIILSISFSVWMCRKIPDLHTYPNFQLCSTLRIE